MKKKAAHLPTLLLILFSIFFTVFFIEIFLVINDRSKASIRDSHITLNKNPYHFLEEEEAFLKIKNSIAFIGDSFTLGEKCGNDHNYPGEFKRILKKNNSELSTLNLGIRGTGTFSYLNRTQDLLTSLGSPAAIIFTMFMNDIELEPSLCQYIDLLAKDGLFNNAEHALILDYCEQVEKVQRRAGYPKIRVIHRWFALHFHSYRLVQEGLLKLLIAADYDIGWGRMNYPEKWDEQAGLNFKLIEFSLKEIKKITEKYGIPIIIVFYPDISYLSPESPLVAIYQAAAEKLTAELSVPVYSGYEAFLSRNDLQESMIWSITDRHPNCEAHKTFADWVFSKAVSHGIVFPQELE
jgi:hypothetical protein